MRSIYKKAANHMTHKYLQIFPATLTVLLVLCTASPLDAEAQSTHAASAPSLREPALDKLAQPIALYPDALLAQLLMASTYPLDVAEASRWIERHPEPTAAAIAALPWENSVKALLPFAPILAMLNNEKKWRGQLAAAVIKQPTSLLRTIQMLRERAYNNGALHAANQQQVLRQDRIIVIQPADTRAIYVPYYDPAKVYSASGNSLLPPEYWAAQPYAAPQNKVDGIVFSVGIDVPDRAFYLADIDWRRMQLTVRHAATGGNVIGTGPEEWLHNPQYRKHKAAKAPSTAIGTESTPRTGTSIGTRDAAVTPPAPGGSRISTRRPQGDGR
jgi:hypothetical protein